MREEKTYYLDVKRRPSHSATFATLPASLRGSMAYLSSVENRKNIFFFVNFALLICSLILIGESLLSPPPRPLLDNLASAVGTGASLMGFYRIHMLEVISIDFLLVPIIMTGGGILTMITALTGMVAIAKEDSCRLLAYSVMTGINFFILTAGVIASVRKVSFRPDLVVITDYQTEKH